MSTVSIRQRSRAFAVFTAVCVISTLFAAVAPAAFAGSFNLTVADWTRNPQGGAVSYDMTLRAGGANEGNAPCVSVCYWCIDASYKNGSTDVGIDTLAQDSATGASDFERRLTTPAGGRQLSEITHVRARLVPNYGWYETWTTDWIKVADPATGSLSLSVVVWRRDSSNGTVTHDLLLEGKATARRGGPCEGVCTWYVDAYYKNGGSESLGIESATGSWDFSRRLVTPNGGKQLPEISHIRARLIPNYSGYETWDTGLIPVSDYIYKGHDMTQSAPVLDPVLAANGGFFCTRFLVHAGSHFDRSTVSDQYLACEAAVGAAAGYTIYKVLEAIVDQAGAPSIDVVVEDTEKPFPRPTSTPIDLPLDQWRSETGCEQEIPEWSVDAVTAKIERDHGFNSTTDKSKWGYRVPWRDLVWPHAMEYKATQGSRPDHCERVINYGYPVGYERIYNSETGQRYRETWTYTVVTDKEYGNLITAHPGLPGEDQ